MYFYSTTKTDRPNKNTQIKSNIYNNYMNEPNLNKKLTISNLINLAMKRANAKFQLGVRQ